MIWKFLNILFCLMVFLGCSDESPFEDNTLTTDRFVDSIIFTEIDPVNTAYKDHEGGDAGWVELYNKSSESVNLKGLSLTNSLDNPSKWVFGDVVIEPQSFMVVFLSGKNLPDYVAPHDSFNLIGSGCSIWTDSESFAEPLEGEDHLCFDENGVRVFGARMRLGDYKMLGWYPISSFVGTRSGDAEDVLDISSANEILMQAYITKDRDVSFKLAQTGVEDWNGYEIVFRGTGDSSTVYRASIPSGKSYPDLSIIYGTRMSPQTYENLDVTVKVTSYIARNRGHEPHASFKIKNEPGSLFLIDENARVVAQIDYPDLPVGKSWSLESFAADDEDGGNLWGYSDPSPYSWSQDSVKPEKSPSVDSLVELPASGFYEKSFKVEFPDSLNVRCAVGGMDPTSTSPLTKKLTISSTTVLRCASFSPNALSGDILTRTYVFESAPDLPVFFLTIDSNALFNPDTGIFMEGTTASSVVPHYGANYWEDREIPVHVELLERGENEPAFAENAGLKVVGQYSRVNAKKSVAITFREKYGKKRLDYPLFPDSPELTKFKTFVLRDNGSNYTNEYYRDMLASSISKGLDLDYLRGRAAVAFYNGEYYGIHNIRERAVEYYFETHYDYDPDDIDLLKADNSVTAGSNVGYLELVKWLNSNHLDDEDNYIQFAKHVDVDNLMNYMLLEIFANSRDWPFNNVKKWRVASSMSKWRFLVYDLDVAFGCTSSSYTNNIFEFALNSEGNPDDQPNGPAFTLLLRRLLENHNARTAFINRMSTLLSTNFSSERVKNRMDELHADIESEISRDQKRWNHKVSKMNKEFEKTRAFVEKRPGVILDELREYFELPEPEEVTLSVDGVGQILVDGLPVYQNPVTINFFPGVPVALSVKPATGHVWAGWNDGGLNQTRIVNPGEVKALTAFFK